MAFPDPAPKWTYQEVADTVRRRSLWMEVLGILLIVLGFFALAFEVAASYATTYLIGGVLLAAGSAQIILTGAFWRRRVGGFALAIILGFLCIIAGLLCLLYPTPSLVAITLILGGYFIASGIARIVVNFRERFPGWGWGVASALAELLLGVLTLGFWPSTSLIILGVILGVQLIFS